MNTSLLPRAAIETIYRQQAARFGAKDVSPETADIAKQYKRIARLCKDQDDLATIAGIIGYEIAVSGPFDSLNRGTAAAAMEVQVELGDKQLAASNAEITMTFVDVGAGRLSRDQLVAWIADHLEAVPDSGDIQTGSRADTKNYARETNILAKI